MSDDLVFEVPENVKAETLVDEAKYHEMYAESLRDPDAFSNQSNTCEELQHAYRISKPVPADYELSRLIIENLRAKFQELHDDEVASISTNLCEHVKFLTPSKCRSKCFACVYRLYCRE